MQAIDYNNQISNTPFVSVLQYGAIGDGTTDDTTAIQNAINTGANIFLPAGTYKITSSLVGKANQTIIGAGIGATTINQTSVADAITYTNVSRFTLKSLSISSLGNCVHIALTSGFILYPQFEDIEITAIGDTYSAFWFDVQILSDIYFPALKNIIINGGSPAPHVGTRIGINFTTTSTTGSGTVGPAIIGGRITNVFYGIYIAAVGSIMSYGTAFDGITNDITNAGNGTAIALYFVGPTGSNFFTNTRFESTPAIDVYVNFTSAAADNYIQCVASLANTTRWVDNGSHNSWYGLDGSVTNGQINHMWYPMLWEGQATFNEIVKIPNQVNNAVAIGGTVTDNNKGGTSLLSLKAPNSSWGFPLSVIADSSNQGITIVDQSFSSSGSTGNSMAFYADGRIIPAKNGGGSQQPLVIPSLTVNSLGAFANAALLNGILTASVTWNPGAIAIGGTAQNLVTVTNCALGDIAYASFTTIGTNSCQLTATCVAGGVWVNLTNQTGASWTPGSGTLKVIVFKF